MPQIPLPENPVLALIVAGLVLVGLVFWVLRWRRRRADPVRRLSAAASGALRNLLIPSGHDEELLLDLVLLSARGLLVVELRRVDGHLFGSEKMAEWTVLGSGRRQTFPNPRHRMLDRIAALRRLVPDVPVSGQFTVWGRTEFGRGRPADVMLLDELIGELLEERGAGEEGVRAFRPAWDQLQRYAQD